MSQLGRFFHKYQMSIGPASQVTASLDEFTPPPSKQSVSRFPFSPLLPIAPQALQRPIASGRSDNPLLLGMGQELSWAQDPAPE